MKLKPQSDQAALKINIQFEYTAKDKHQKII